MAEGKSYSSALKETNRSFMNRLKNFFSGSDITDDDYEELMETLILCDVGVECADILTDEVRAKVEARKVTRKDQLVGILKETLIEKLSQRPSGPDFELPAIIMAVGVNGSGKTTTIGKMAYKYSQEGKKVMVAAADTFRAAAVEQLASWAESFNVPIVRSEMGADPASVAFDAVVSATAKEVDLLIVDTAGRLQNKVNLMQELGKMHNVLNKGKKEMNLYAFITVDATSGLNVLSQTDAFMRACNVNGIAVSKLDSSSKGGVLIPLVMQYDLPVWYIGTGEKAEDLRIFDPKEYVEAMLGE